MTEPYSEDAMRARFHALGKEKARIEKDVAPLRAKREALAKQAQEIDRQIRPLEAEIRKITQPGLYDIDMERARLARALGGKTGEPPGD